MARTPDSERDDLCTTEKRDWHKYVVAAKVIDIFGHDTLTLMPVTVGTV